MENLGLWTVEEVEFSKWGSLGRPCRNTDDSSAENRVDYTGPAQKATEGTAISRWPGDHPCDIFGKHCDYFSPLSLNMFLVYIRQF